MEWSNTHAPVADTVATATQPAPGEGKRNICTGFDCSLCAGTTAPAAFTGILRLIDGASGGTTYLWQMRFSLRADAGAMVGISKHFKKPIAGSVNTAMTLEWSAQPGANAFESVSFE